MRKKLTKSNKNIVLTGTLAGIAEYIGIDPTVVRVIYVFLSLVAFGSPIILYILLALLVPSGKRDSRRYGHDNDYYQKNNYREQTNKRKEAEKINDDEWSDF
ncbi:MULTISPECIES: PspC domain-containing protein [Enterococcus]|uniref:PspC protein n=1 Tax=Candidatus Enterococcus mangumiae TaxID=2230878 RepID=A0ABZ2SS31_9ENTE|nr:MULTISPECIES: PspC domain-containing protein [unclassified Enterococcus]MBO0460678.1 PspC domain-containing protein [Enterococcus sp. DIV1298c]MBO0488851.1 PspC domain-containing protein [Enterococcus sp. DIV1094]MBO1301197.1 PspC domain-containing protein [Enterococcus sp. DIV1271a]